MALPLILAVIASGSPTAMKFRVVTIFTGKRFRVPQCIQRIDHKATHGWQLRYGGTKLYSDHSNDGSGAAAALKAAVAELRRRIEKLPAPSGLQKSASSNKTSELPVGISGPLVRQRPGSTLLESNLSVSLPRFGATAQRRTVYIGTENTYSVERYLAALERAIEMRRKAERAYQRDATRAMREASRKLLGA